MTRRLKAPQRRARRAARRNREGGDPVFDLCAIAARSAGEPGMPARPWPASDAAFLAAVLAAHHLPAPLVERLARAAAALPLGTRLVERLSAALADQFHFAPLGELLRQSALLLFGPPGAGKTTLAAKLAARRGERAALLLTTDVGRPGAFAQLEEYAGVLGMPAKAASDAPTLQRLLADGAGRSAVIDTAGVAPGDAAARDRIAAFITAAAAEPILVLPADCAAVEAVAMVEFFAPLRPRNLLATRLDLVQRLGGVLAAAETARLALPGAGITPHFAYGLRQLTAEMVARRLLAGALHDARSALPAA